MARGKRPKITWGTGFANTLTFRQPLDDIITGTRQREGSVRKNLPSGAVVSSVVGLDHVLEGVVRWIPIADQTLPVPATGWDGAAGWDAFLQWAWGDNAFRFYPDASLGTFFPMWLEEPSDDTRAGNEKGYRHRALFLRMRTADSSTLTGY